MLTSFKVGTYDDLRGFYGTLRYPCIEDLWNVAITILGERGAPEQAVGSAGPGPQVAAASGSSPTRHPGGLLLGGMDKVEFGSGSDPDSDELFQILQP